MSLLGLLYELMEMLDEFLENEVIASTNQIYLIQNGSGYRDDEEAYGEAAPSFSFSKLEVMVSGFSGY